MILSKQTIGAGFSFKDKAMWAGLGFTFVATVVASAMVLLFYGVRVLVSEARKKLAQNRQAIHRANQR